jgi:hypothetical protein
VVYVEVVVEDIVRIVGLCEVFRYVDMILFEGGLLESRLNV